MKSMTLTANSYARKKRLNGIAEATRRVTNEADDIPDVVTLTIKEVRAQNRLDELKKETCKTIEDAGITPDYITAVINDIRTKKRLEKYYELIDKLREIAKGLGLDSGDIPDIVRECKNRNKVKNAYCN